ncbi:hypothetical protein O3P69_010867 [Scylla paramamosain]|uniref:Uncharacterized protein n=1 Tax=Scylla paramamosain TaxID=85552 RepID=A0AAW0TFN5_SCYPA
MVQGTTVCGTFITGRNLNIAVVVLLMLLILSTVAMGLSINYPDDPLFINGCVLTGFSVIGLVCAAVLRCHVKDHPMLPQTNIVMNSNAMPGNTTVVMNPSSHLHSPPY